MDSRQTVDTAVRTEIYRFFVEHGIAFENDFITFNGNYFSGILIYEIFNPAF